MINEYLQIFYQQTVRHLQSQTEVNQGMSKTTFLPELCDDLLFYCTSYFDSVRDEASRALLFIGTNLAKFDTPIPQEARSMIQQLRANLTLGWNESLTGPIKECAELEKDVSTWMFREPADFIDKILTVMIDEPTTRDQLSKFVMVINKSLPFLLMNDYRISVGQNRLQRVELLKRILQEGI